MASAPRPTSAFSAQVVSGVILLIGVFGSIWAYYDARERELQRAETEFTRRATILHSLTREIIGRYESAVFDLRAMFALEGGVTRTDFTQATRSLAERNPGVKAFEWVPVVSAADRAAVESNLSREQGRPMEITERDATGRLVRAAARPEYYPIVYAEPVAGNERALGYDLKSGPTLGALERARQTHQMALSGQIRLVQENQDQRGVVMIWPVHRIGPSALPGETGAPIVFRGFVQAVFRVQDMLESTRTQTWNPESILDMLFVDDSEANPARRVLYYRPSHQPSPREPFPTEQEFRRGVYDEHALAIGDRNWKILYRPRAGWLEEQIPPLPWVRTLGVLFITVLLAGLVQILGRRSAVIAREVTERTAELNESRRLLDGLLQALPGMAYRCIYNEQLRVLYVSEGAEALTGYSADDFIWGKVHFRQLIHPADVARVRSATRAGLKEHREIEVEYRLLHRDGTEKWILSRSRGVVVDDGPQPFLEGLAIDITANKRAEADRLAFERKLLDSQKLESLGLLAGGIAHDFNNILTGILGNANLARLKLQEGSVAMPHLRKIELATARAAELCQQMLAYSGKSSFLIEPVDLSQLVQDTLPLLHASIASRSRLQLDLSPHPVVAMADATQLRQIVMNLVLNAADALGENSGEIHISTGVGTFDHDFLRAARDGEALPPGEYVFVKVRDTGCGMTPETIARIFDPFFTTKFTGRGLGLAAVRGIVRGHRGALHVASVPDEGSTFTFVLPPSPTAPAAAAPAASPPRHYSGKVLVIDDEATVRDATSELLVSFGFTAVTAENGADGIAQFRVEPGSFALVLLDLTMPELNGENTLVALRAVAPQVRVLLISGYSESDRANRLAGVGRVGFLQKPFTRDGLECKLRELLD